MSDYIAGFKYLFDIHMGLSRGPVNELMEIRVGDRPAWRGSSTDNTPINIDVPELFGGVDGEGGVQGAFIPLFGDATQTAPSEMGTILTMPAPGFRRRMTAFFSGMISAMNPYPKPWKFKLRRTTAGWDGAPWYPEKAEISLLRRVSVGEVPTYPGEGLVTENVTTTVSGLATLETLPGITPPLGEFPLAPTPWGFQAYIIPLELPPGATLVLGAGEGSAPVGEVYRISYGGWYNPDANFTPVKENLNWVTDWTVVDGNKLALNPASVSGVSGTFLDGGPTLPTTLSYPIYFTHTFTFTYLPPTSADPTLRTIRAMNPAHIIYECLTNREWGRGLPRERLDDSVWRLAADQLWEEQFGLCIRWTRQQPIQQFIKSILDHIGAVIYTDRTTSLIRLRLIRADYDSSTLPLFDTSSGLLEINEAPVSSPGPMVNEFKVQYRDPITDETRVVRAVNLAMLRASGGEINSTTKSFPGLPTQEIADRVAKRELRATSTTLRRFSLTFDRRGSQIVPGGVIRIQDYPRNIPDTIIRIATVDYGSPRDGKIKVQAVQDVFGLPSRGFAALPPPSWTPPNRQPCVGMFDLFELPYRSVYRRLSAADLAFVPDEAGFIGTALAEGQPLNASYDIAVRSGLPEAEDQPSGEGAFCGYSRVEYGGLSFDAAYSVNGGGSANLDLGYEVTGVEPDPHYAQVVKLLMFDDADTPLLDSSPLGTNATASTAFLRDGSNPRFGLASMTSPTPPAAFLLNAPKPASSDDEDWTWDCWFKWREDTTYTGFLRVTNWVIYVKNTGANRALKLSQAGFLVFTGPTALDTGEWMHLEVGWKKTGPSTSTTYFFVNGTLEGTYTGAGGNSPIKLASSIIIGSPNSSGFSGMAGWIDAWRLTVGVCRHTENFTPPSLLGNYLP